MSSQLKEKQQQQSASESRRHQADYLFNQHLFKTAAYTGVGMGIGMLSSLFFKHKAGMTMLFAGAGAGYGISGMVSDLDNFKKFTNYNSQGQGQSHNLRRDDVPASHNWDRYQPKDTQSKHRYGGSDDNDSKEDPERSYNIRRESPYTTSSHTTENDKGSKDFSKVASGSKGHEDKPSSIIRDSPYTTSSHSTSEDKGSKDYSRSNYESARSQTHNKDDDKTSQSFGSNKSKGSPSSFEDRGSDKSSHSSGSHESQRHGKQYDSMNKVQDKHDSEKHQSNKGSSHHDEHQKGGKQGGRRDATSDGSETGQQLQSFHNIDAGKPAPGESASHRGSERPKESNKALGNLRDQQNRIEQDRWGSSTGTGNKNYFEKPSDTLSDAPFRGKSTAGSQTNAVIE